MLRLISIVYIGTGVWGILHPKKDDKRKALRYWSDAWNLAMASKDASGIFNTGWSMGDLYARGGDKEKAREFLNIAVHVGKQAGFKDIEKVEQLLSSLES